MNLGGVILRSLNPGRIRPPPPRVSNWPKSPGLLGGKLHFRPSHRCTRFCYELNNFLKIISQESLSPRVTTFKSFKWIFQMLIKWSSLISFENWDFALIQLAFHLCLQLLQHFEFRAKYTLSKQQQSCVDQFFDNVYLYQNLRKN